MRDILIGLFVLALFWGGYFVYTTVTADKHYSTVTTKYEPQATEYCYISGDGKFLICRLTTE